MTEKKNTQMPELGEGTAVVQQSPMQRQLNAESFMAARNAKQEDALRLGQYITAHKEKQYMTARIAAVESRKDLVYWVCYDGPVTIWIPYAEAYELATPEDLRANTNAARERQKQVMSKSIGAEIKFIIKDIVPSDDNSEYFVYASRKEAMEDINSHYMESSKNNTGKVLEVGQNVTAQFVSIGAYAAIVEVAGRDIRVVNAQLSHRYIADLTKQFVPGDKIEMRITKLAIKDDKLDIVVSALPCELEKCQPRIRRIRAGNRCNATITTVRNIKTSNGPKFIATLWLEGYDLPGYASVINCNGNNQAYSGSPALVQINGVSDNGYVHCKILRFI